MRKALASVLLLSLLACTSLSDLKKVDKEQYFILAQDHVRTEVRGLANVKWVEGLKAGKYIAVAQDDDGIYFKGEGPCVYLLPNEDADAYLKTGRVPEAVVQDPKRFPRAVNVGGLWIPKDASKEPKLFFEVRNTTDGTQLGVTGVAMVAATEGSLSFRPYGSEKEFIKSLTIVGQ